MEEKTRPMAEAREVITWKRPPAADCSAGTTTDTLYSIPLQ